MKIIVNLVRFLVGALFIFSGGVKAIDPLGTSYKMHDYFSAFAYDFTALKGMMEFFTEQSLFLAVFMIVLEIAVGVALLVGYQNRINTWLLFLIVAFFTLLTGYTFLNGFRWESFFNFGSWTFDEKLMKVTDCGCFGDFLKLHPRESFYKDLVLIVLSGLLLWKWRLIGPNLSDRIGGGISWGLTAISLIYCFSNYVWDLPDVDFRPYKIGNSLPEQMVAQKDPVVEYFFVYKNKASGENKNFTMSNIGEANKEEWEFVERIENVIDPGIPAKVINFLIEDDEMGEMNDAILHNEEYAFMVVAYDLTKTNTGAFPEKLNPLAAAAEKAGLDFYAVTNSKAEDFRHEYQTMYPFYKADATFLKTIIRSNPGVLLWKNGVVVDKWHHKQLPTFEEIDAKHGLTN